MRKLPALCLILSLTACEGADPHLSNAVATALGKSSVKITQSNSNQVPLPVRQPPTQRKVNVGLKPFSTDSNDSCESNDPRQICLGLKYVVYEDGSLNLESGNQKALSNIGEVNKIWEACQIRFSIRDYALVKPNEFGLKQRTSDFQQLEEIRKAFQPKSQEKNLLVVVTDNWNRSGSLGNSWANAWTKLPGERLLGSIVERRVGDDITIIAHELGHYLSLDHEEDWRNLMNPLIFENSRDLVPAQCSAARWAAKNYFLVPES